MLTRMTTQHAEGERARDKERFTHIEARLNVQIERLEKDLDMSHDAARQQALQLQERAGVLQCVAVWCSVVRCGVKCGSVLQCVAVCCSVLQCAAM